MVAFDIGVAVPLAARAAVELDEAHAVLDQPPRQQAIASEDGGLFVIQAIHLARGFALAAEVHGLRGFTLHLKGQLVTADAGFEVGVVGARRGMKLIEVRKQVEFVALAARSDAFRRFQIFHRHAFGAEFHALIPGGHEPRAPIAHAVDDGALAVLDDDKGGQVLVQGAEAVGNPRPERRPAAGDGAGIHLADAAGVVDAIGPAGLDDREVVRVFRHVREPIRHPQPALAVLFPLPRRAEQRRVVLAHRHDRRLVTRRQRLAVEFVEQRLALEGIEMTRAAFHEEENHALGPAEAVRDFRRHRIRRTGGEERASRQRSQRQRAEAAPRLAQEVTAGTGLDDVVARHGGGIRCVILFRMRKYYRLFSPRGPFRVQIKR